MLFCLSECHSLHLTDGYPVPALQSAFRYNFAGVIGSLDPSIKQYADSLYEKALLESANTLRRESIEYLQQRSKSQDQGLLFSGVDYQKQVRIHAGHIERSTVARLDSYQRAFNEINKPPTEAELREILDDFKATWELQIKHSDQALRNFLAARNAPPGIDLAADLRASSAHGHDRVLQEWKIWRARVLLQRNTNFSPESRSHDGLSLSREVTQSGAVGTEPAGRDIMSQKPRNESTVRSAFISYSWDDDAHREWVHALARRLRADGVDVSIDRWAAVPGDQLSAFMERAIRDNQFVIVICTPRYKLRSDNREGGVGYEGDIMTAEIMTSQNHRKFIPVLRRGRWSEAAPSWLLGRCRCQEKRQPVRSWKTQRRVG
jgi:hypothetical protein